MTERLDPDSRARELLAPVWPMIEKAAARLPAHPRLTICVGEVEGWSKLVGHTLVLSEGLAGPAPFHPGERPGPLPPVDRWRRAAGCVLEAAATLAMAKVVGANPGPGWTWEGGAVDLADQVCPELQLAAPELASAVMVGDLVAQPRAGVAVMRAWRAAGHDPWARLGTILRDGAASPAEMLEVATWVFDRVRGPMGLLPVLVSPVAPADVPVRLGPWRFQPILVPAHHRGGLVAIDGDGAVAEPWAPAGVSLRTIAASGERGCQLRPESGGPVGTWEVASAQGFGQVMGARGVSFTFHGSGALDVVLADAFVGPLAALGVADDVGTSGTVSGSWKVAGPRTLAFAGIRPKGMTMHSRQRDKFRMPAEGFGMGEWLKAMEDGPWWWERAGDRLVLRGPMMGATVEIRLKPPS